MQWSDDRTPNANHPACSPLEGRPPILPSEERDRIAERFPPAPPADERSLAGRLARLKRQANGREPFIFDEVMELAYRPGPGLSFIDNTFVEHDGKLWNFHITGSPEDLEKADPRIRKLAYEYTGYAVGSGLFDLEYRGLILSTPQGEWDCVATGVPVNIHPYADGFACVTTGVGMQGTRCGVAFSTDLLHWQYHERNPVLPPPPWAEPYGACKDSHILRIGDTYHIYYIVTAKLGYSAIALATTTDWDRFELAPEPVFLFPAGLRGTGGCESPCILERDGVFHLFFCNGPGTWHTISDRPRPVPRHQRHLPGRAVRRRRGLPLGRPLVAVEHPQGRPAPQGPPARHQPPRRHRGRAPQPGRHVRRRGHVGR